MDWRRIRITNLTEYIKEKLIRHGADLVGIGDLTEIPANIRSGLPVGVCVAVKYPKEVIQHITEWPTQEYCDWYHRLNEHLDQLVMLGAAMLQVQGYSAIAQTRKHVSNGEATYSTVLPHKTIATRAGIGWIGKSALLVTDCYGSMIRLSSILTNAPLATATPVNDSKCGDCMVCTTACPAGAVAGREWKVGLYRDEFFDSKRCRETARERSKRAIGDEITLCGKCIAVCPYTKRYLGRDTV